MAEPDSGAPLAGAFVDLSSWWKLEIRGAGARAWLNDLVSADIGALAPGEARRSLLLSPTGRIRAEFTVAARDEAFLLLQDARQAAFIGALLEMYVLSSAVELADRTDGLVLFALPERAGSPPIEGSVPSVPSCLGAGSDLLAASDAGGAVRAALAGRFREAGPDEVERWRILRGIRRFGVDAFDEDLPAEGGLASAVAFDKGCYLGQEAIAKVRNLGHPRRVTVALSADAPLAVDDAVFGPGGEVGRLTSAAEHAGRWVALGRVRWDAHQGPFRTASGVLLEPSDTPAQTT